MTMLDAFSRGLAFAFLDGDWDHAGLLTRGQRAVADRAKWLPRVCKQVLVAFPERPADDRELVPFLRSEVERAGLTSDGRTLPLIRNGSSPSRRCCP